MRVGLATGPPLNFKVRPFSGGGGPLEYLFPSHQKPSEHNASEALSSSTGGCGTHVLMRWVHGVAGCIRAATGTLLGPSLWAEPLMGMTLR